MKKTITILAAGLLTSAACMFTVAPATAADIDINIGVPTVVAQPRPVYVQPQYEMDWRERQARAAAWRANPVVYAPPVKTVVHSHGVHKKHHHKHHVKHHGKGHAKHHGKHDD